MNCNYKVKLSDIQNKYKFNIFCTGSYNDSDLRKMIESVYYALPRTSGEGTSVTLNDTAFSYLKNKLYATETSQEGTPTPETPQTIHTISGDNEVVVRRKNLINRTTCTENKMLAWALGTLIDDSNSLTTDYIVINVNDKVISNYKSQVMFYDSSKEYLGCLQSGGTTIAKASGDYFNSFTVPNESSIKYMRLGFRSGANGNENMTTLNIMSNLGTTLYPYEPYQSNSILLTLGDKEICKKGNYEDKIYKAIKGDEIYDSLSVEEKNTLDYGKWYLRKKIIKDVASNDDMVFNTNAQATGYNSFSTTKYNGLIETTNKYDLFCNMLQPITSSDFVNGVRIASSGNVIIDVATDFCEFSNNGIRTKLQQLYDNGTPMTFYLPLKTPTNEKFNDTIQDQLEDIYNNMLSYEGQTNVSQVNEDLPFNINSTAIKDLNNL